MAGATVLKLQLGSLELDLNDTDTNGTIISSISIPGPAVRAVTNDTQGQDGADDQTQNFSAGTVVLTGALVPNAAGDSRSKAKDLLAPFLAPGARPTLVFAFDTDMDPRCIDMRVDSWTNPIDHPANATGLQLQWATPNPIAYDSTVNEVDIATSTGSGAGRVYPTLGVHNLPPYPYRPNNPAWGRSYNRVYPSNTASAATPVVTNGTYVSWPTLIINGPCSNPSVIWVDPVTSVPTGTQVVLSGLSLSTGDTLVIDTKAKTVLFDGEVGASRYSFIDFVNTVWGPLQPGANALIFSAFSASSPAEVQVFWQDTFLP